MAAAALVIGDVSDQHLPVGGDGGGDDSSNGDDSSGGDVDAGDCSGGSGERGGCHQSPRNVSPARGKLF